jgi:hypothetical protein
VPTLHELQRRIAAALLDAAPLDIAADIRADGVSATARLDIYRAHLRATFLRTLTLEYPVIERLVGREYFARLALEFQAAHASRCGDLQPIGAPFAAFLRARFGGGRYDYWADVAALEWAYQEVQIAPETADFNCDLLRHIDGADYARLHFELHPACRLVASAYPVLDIWHANQTGCESTPIIDLASGATHALVHRRAHNVQFHRLSAASFALLAALAQSLTLGAALDAAQNLDADFDLAAALCEFVTLGALARATLCAPCATACVPARPA